MTATGAARPATGASPRLPAPAPGSLVGAAPLLALGEVDDQRDAVEPVALAEAVLDEVRVVARDAVARVDLDRDAWRPRPDLGAVDELEPVALLGGRLADLHHVTEELVE